MRTTTILGVIALTLLSIGVATAGGPSGKILAYGCSGCHGTDGSSVGLSNPHIAGMDKGYFIESMEAYQHDERNSTIMNRLAKGYTAEQIEAMADFFAAQPLRLLPQQHDAAKARLGAELHDKYCEKCHENGGRAPSESGNLAGQWALYLRYCMDDYLTGEREMTKKMRAKVEKMQKAEGKDAVDALIHFYASFDK